MYFVWVGAELSEFPPDVDVRSPNFPSILLQNWNDQLLTLDKKILDKLIKFRMPPKIDFVGTPLRRCLKTTLGETSGHNKSSFANSPI